MTDFWDWAVAAYAGEGVAEACLNLQDEHDQCIPLLLWAAWRSSQGAAISQAQADLAVALARPWAEQVIAPVRAVRRRLKKPLSDGDESVRLPLRTKIQAAELAAEHALMSQLAALPDAGNATEPPVGQALEVMGRANLLVCIRAWGEKIPPDNGADLIHALTKGDFLRYNARP